MTLDSKETRDFIASMANKHNADAVIIRPDSKTAWEFDKAGKVVKQDVSPLLVTDKGRRVYCIPVPSGEEGLWSCGVYSEADIETSEFTEQFPG